MWANPVLFPQVTNRETWNPIIAVFDQDTDEAVSLSGLTSIVLEIRYAGRSSGHFASPTVPFYDDLNDARPVVTLSLGSGIVVLDVGYFQPTVAEATMRTLCAGTYDVGCTASDGTTTRQLFLGRLPVLDGKVTN